MNIDQKITAFLKVLVNVYAMYVSDFKSDDRSNHNKHVKRVHNEHTYPMEGFNSLSDGVLPNLGHSYNLT